MHFKNIKITEDSSKKAVTSSDYNYIFNKITGHFVRWGATPEDDPNYGPAPEIADIEISTICSQGCKFCYKNNTACGKNMSFSDFKTVFHKLPPNLTQIAFGIGDIDGNPDLWDIMHYAREHGVIPNITINGSRMEEGHEVLLARLCGAVAVSNYNTETCYRTIRRLNWYQENVSFCSLKQINIHQLLCEETYDECKSLILDYVEGRTPEGLNAIVFLMLKPKGRSVKNQFHMLSDMRKFRYLIDMALDYKVPIGFDSCSCNSFLKAIKGRSNEKELAQCADPCESTCFSIYIDVDGFVMPCSFSSGMNVPRIDMNKVDDFLKDVWFNPKMNEWRDSLLKNCRSCPLYDLEMR